MRERIEAIDEACRPLTIQQTMHKVRETTFVAFVRRQPARLLLTFPGGFERIGLHPLDESRVDAVQRPRAEQGLVEHIFVRRRRYSRSSRRDDELGVELPPLVHASRPLVRKFGEREQPRTRVLATFGVVSCGCGQAVRPLGGALLHPPMEIRNRQRAGSRITADLVEGQEAVKTIERSVLQRLCHHRAGELLNLKCKAAVACDAMADAAGAMRSSVSASRRKSKISTSEPNHSARALASAPSMIARSSRLGPDAVTYVR